MHLCQRDRSNVPTSVQLAAQPHTSVVAGPCQSTVHASQACIVHACIVLQGPTTSGPSNHWAHCFGNTAQRTAPSVCYNQGRASCCPLQPAVLVATLHVQSLSLISCAGSLMLAGSLMPAGSLMRTCRGARSPMRTAPGHAAQSCSAAPTCRRSPAGSTAQSGGGTTCRTAGCSHELHMRPF